MVVGYGVTSGLCHPLGEQPQCPAAFPAVAMQLYPCKAGSSTDPTSPKASGTTSARRLCALKARAQPLCQSSSADISRSSLLHPCCTSPTALTRTNRLLSSARPVGPGGRGGWPTRTCVDLVRDLRFQKEPAHTFPIQVLEKFQLITWNR